MSKALTKTNAIPATITSDMLFKQAGANRLPDRVKFEGSVYDGTKQHANDPMEAIEGFTKAIHSEFEWTERIEYYPGFTMDELAVALNTVMRRLDGFVTQTVKTSPIDKPATRRVPIGYNLATGNMNYVVVPDGATSLPFRKVGNTQPWIQVGQSHKGPYIQANILRCDQSLVEGLLQYVRQWSEQNSIYLGQVVGTNFEFINMTKFDPSKVALTDRARVALELYVRGPLKYMDALLEKRQDTKTGLLMYGPPGGGKTMIVSLCEYQAITEGAAVIHVDPATGVDGLARANVMATRLMNAGHMVLISFEDMEKLAQENRAKVLEILDGASAKTARRIIIGTTNFIEGIDRAMIRHGRFDDVLWCGLPDRSAFEQVIKVFFPPEELDADLDFDEAFPHFEGYSYATIGNAASKIIRSAINRAQGKLEDFKVTTQDLINAAQMVRDQHELVNVPPVVEAPVFDSLLRDMLREQVTEEVTAYIYDNVPFGDTTDYDQVFEMAKEASDQVVKGRMNGARISDRQIVTN